MSNLQQQPVVKSSILSAPKAPRKFWGIWYDFHGVSVEISSNLKYSELRLLKNSRGYLRLLEIAGERFIVINLKQSQAISSKHLKQHFK